MNLYAIDYEFEVDGHVAYRHTTIAAESAKDAIDEFFRNHLGTEIRELRRSHVH